jgi:GTPase SAR1 family protein
MANPYIIVTLGPTGSGKTSMINSVISYLTLDTNYNKFLVDDLVENNHTYKEKVFSITENIMRQCKSERKFCLDDKCENCDTSNYYLNPTQELLQEFGKAYIDVRKGPNCVKESELNCDLFNDTQLREAIKNNKNIVFETTGINIPNWLLSSPPDDPIAQFINSKYKVIFAYSLVYFNELIQRNKNRLLKSLADFKEDRTKPGPRLPNIEYNEFKKMVRKIKDTLLKLYDTCIVTHDSNECGTTKIERLLLFDTNGPDMTLAFDSVKDTISRQEFIKMVNVLFGLELGGGRKLSKQKRYNLNKRSNKKIINRRKFSKKL